LLEADGSLTLAVLICHYTEYLTACFFTELYYGFSVTSMPYKGLVTTEVIIKKGGNL